MDRSSGSEQTAGPDSKTPAERQAVRDVASRRSNVGTRSDIHRLADAEEVFTTNNRTRRVSDGAALMDGRDGARADLPEDYKSTNYQGARRRHSDADLPDVGERSSLDPSSPRHGRVYVNSDDDEASEDEDEDDGEGVVAMLFDATITGIKWTSLAVETGVRWTWGGLMAPPAKQPRTPPAAKYDGSKVQ
jgi:hypothetical protein